MNDFLNPRLIDLTFIEQFLATQADKPVSQVVLHYMSDNGGYADLAKAEIRKRLDDINIMLASEFSSATGNRKVHIRYHDIPPQDWRAGAFDIAQLARDTVRGAGNVIFLNCAPRLKQRGVEKDNAGESVYAGMLRNGTVISAVGEGSFMLFRDLIEKGDLEIHPVHVQTKGTQFRSRQFFPWESVLLSYNLQAHAADWKRDIDVAARRELMGRMGFIDTGALLMPEYLPDLKAGPEVLRVDTHGNLKISPRFNAYADRMNEFFDVRIGRKRPSVRVQLVEGMFVPPEGTMALAPGSSGDWPDSNEGKFLQLAINGGNCREFFNIEDGELRDGLPIEIRPVAQANLVALGM